MPMDKDTATTMFREMMAALGPDAVAEIVAQQPKPPMETRVMPSEPVRIYALQDIINAEGGVVHKRRHVQSVPPVDAREIMRGGLYGFNDPGPLRPTVVPSPSATEVVPLGNDDSTLTGDAGGQRMPLPFVLTGLPGVNDKVARAMEDAGLGSVEALRNANVETLATVPGMGNKLAERVIAYVAEHYPVQGKEA